MKNQRNNKIIPHNMRNQNNQRESVKAQFHIHSVIHI